MAEMLDVARWLADQRLGQHVEAFAENGIGGDVLRDLTDADLKELGLNLGDRKRLLKAIAALDAKPAEDGVETAERAATTAVPREADRRQLTVMFVDLVGSTPLSAQLDPEDMSALIRAYQNAVVGEVARFEGHVAKYMGDGVLVYFGWPQAHEDDAERAVRAGLALVEAVGGLAAVSSPLAARIGIATGLVMVGELIGEGAAKEQTVVGETPNLAARLQALAEPGRVVISQATRRLVGGLFELSDLGPLRVKGFAEPLAAFRIEGEGRTEGRFEALHGERLTPLIGREHDLAMLLERWRRAKDGEGQVLLIAGDAGIGKSRLLRALREELSGEPHVALRHFCSPYHTNSALHPVITQLERAAGFASHDEAGDRLAKLEALLGRGTGQLDEAVPLIGALLGVPTEGRYPAPDLSPQRQKRRTLEVLVAQLAGLTRERPVLELYEDVHWVDPSTLELLDLLVERVRALPVLVVLTCRPEFSPPWTGQSHVTVLTMNRLGRREGAALVESVTGARSLPAEVLDQIVAQTDGVPLFIEELTKTVIESGLLTDAGDHYELSRPLPPFAIPTTLHDSLMARLDRLAPVKELAQAAAAIGREFSHDLLAAVSPLSEADLDSALDHLVSSELIFRRGTPPDATYRFKHALVQDTAYQSLLKSRRQQWHARIAEILEQKFPDKVKGEPELLARHYTEAGSTGKAVTYWQRAGEQALQRSATLEATAHLAKGLEVLCALPDGVERARRELNLLTTMGPALTATKGYAAPAAGTAYRRALELCRELGDTAKQFSVLHGLWHFHYNRAELDAARSLALQLVDVANGRQDAGLDLAAHRALGYTLNDLGELEASRSCLERVIALYDPAVHGGYAFRHGGSDPGVGSLSIGAWGVWAQGYPDQALGRNAAGLALARKLAHPLSEAWALTSAAAVHQLRGEPKAAQAHAEAAVAIAKERGFALWIDWASVLRGWGRGEQQPSADAIAEMRQGLDASRATGAALWMPYWLALLASVHGRLGQAEEGLVATAEALTEVARTGERFWEAELQRLEGQLLLQADPANQPEAEACFHRATEIARSQKARSWELRAATSLARLWRDQGRPDDARELLAPLYDWFTEGFGTADLKAAQALLDALA